MVCTASSWNCTKSRIFFLRKFMDVLFMINPNRKKSKQPSTSEQTSCAVIIQCSNTQWKKKQATDTQNNMGAFHNFITTLSWVKEARCKREHTVWLFLCDFIWCYRNLNSGCAEVVWSGIGWKRAERELSSVMQERAGFYRSLVFQWKRNLLDH